MTDGPTTALMRKAYARWAPVYDLVYDKLLESAARAAVEAATACGPRILEAGVGTGLSLGYYRGDAEVYGVDLSEHMLQRAKAKVERNGLSQVKSLQVMDVCRLGYADESFDAVAAQFLITLVPDPEGALGEFARVLKPGGEIVLANHFGQADGPLARLEEAAAPFFSKIAGVRISRSPASRRGRAPRPWKSSNSKPVFPGGFFKMSQAAEGGRGGLRF